jgi:hypothetical protein
MRLSQNEDGSLSLMVVSSAGLRIRYLFTIGLRGLLGGLVIFMALTTAVLLYMMKDEIDWAALAMLEPCILVMFIALSVLSAAHVRGHQERLSRRVYVGPWLELDCARARDLTRHRPSVEPRAGLALRGRAPDLIEVCRAFPSDVDS